MDVTVSSLRPDGSGNVWAQVFIDLELEGSDSGSNSVEINVLVTGASSLPVDDVVRLAKAEANYLLGRIVAANK